MTAPRTGHESLLPLAATRRYPPGPESFPMDGAEVIHIENVNENVTISLCPAVVSDEIDGENGYEIDLTPAIALEFSRRLEAAARDRMRGVMW